MLQHDFGQHLGIEIGCTTTQKVPSSTEVPSVVALGNGRALFRYLDSIPAEESANSLNKAVISRRSNAALVSVGVIRIFYGAMVAY
eukprot:5164384-Pleurochrysis_carterae.AAC.1